MSKNKGLSPFQEIEETPIMGGYVLKQKYNGVTFLEFYAKSPGLLLDEGISPVKTDWGRVRSEYPYPHPEQAPYTFIEILIAYCIDSATQNP